MKPKLRFKEFDEDWEEKKLGDIGENIIGMTYSPNDLVDKQNGLLVLRSSNIQNNRIIIQDDKYINLKIPDKKMVKQNDILLCSRNGSRELIGKCAYISKEISATFGAFMTIIRSPYNRFIIQNLRTAQFKKYIYSHLGATINQITNQDLSLYKLCIPSLPEQEKIGQFFSLLDDRIEKQEQKINLLKERKKGWMQKLFNQEIRFKDENGNDYPDWEEKKLGEIVENQMKGKKSTESATGNILLTTDYLDNKIFSYVRNPNNVKSSDLLILWDGSQAGKAYIGYEGVLGSTFMKLELCHNASRIYVYQFLKFREKYIQEKWRTGSGIPHVSKDFISLFIIPFPSLPEQEKIAGFLSKQDELIEKEEEKLSLLKEQKKGLLQQMFV